MKQTTDGFNLGPVLNWLEANKQKVAKKLCWLEHPEGGDYRLAHSPEHLQLTSKEIGDTILRFPLAARKRSVLSRILGMPPTWFAAGTIPEDIHVTTDRNQAMSPTAIVPGKTDTIVWDGTSKEQEIKLYEIPGVPLVIAKYMLVHTLMHEFAHTLLNPICYNNDPYVLEVQGATGYEGFALLMMFAEEASSHPAISHYSAAYRPIPDPDDKRFIARAGEELCESVAAYLMGFIYCDDEVRCWDPFADRPVVKLYVEHFLNGELSRPAVKA